MFYSAKAMKPIHILMEFTERHLVCMTITFIAHGVFASVLRFDVSNSFHITLCNYMGGIKEAYKIKYGNFKIQVHDVL